MKNKFLFISATHGNEGFSVEILKKLERKYPHDKYGYEWIIGNKEAYKKNIRFTKKDLNRSAPGNINSNTYEEKRAAEIVKLSANYDFIIDLHGAISQCGIISIIPFPTFNNLLLASLLEVDKNVIWYAEKSLQSGPIVQYTNCPAVEIECGPQNSKKIQEQLYNILTTFLEKSKNFSIEYALETTGKKEFFAVYDKLEGEHDKTFEDFIEKRIGEEIFYPFMSNQYPNIICYKMKKVDIQEYFLYNGA